jgi:hypothetical protein
VNDAIALATDALKASYTGTLQNRIRELRKGQDALQDFLGSTMKTTLNNKEIVLNNELPRRLRQLLSSVEIKPNVQEIILQPKDKVPDTLGVYVVIDGVADSTSHLLWSSSKSAVTVQSLPVRPDGLHPVIIKPVPPSAGMVTITAEIDMGDFRYELLRQKYQIVNGSFVMSRDKPSVKTVPGEFYSLVVQRLQSRGAITIVERGQYDYQLNCTFLPDSQPGMAMGMFKARGILGVRLFNNEILFVAYFQEKAAMSSQSFELALENLRRVTIDEAVKVVESAF